VQAIVFDFDGTLVDTETPELTIWQDFFAAYGVEMPKDYWTTIVGRGAEQEVERPKALLERLSGRPFTEDDERHARTMALIAKEPLRPGVRALLDQAGGAAIPCAIASSSKHAWVDPAIQSRRIAFSFTTVICADDVERAKPFPDLYLEACRRLGTDPAQTVAIEDSPNGLAAAKAAGLFTIATPNSTTVDLDLSAADLVISDLSQINLSGIRQALVQRNLPHA
jgi:HAD superfamily hydrolase (TIGR01509 family)